MKKVCNCCKECGKLFNSVMKLTYCQEHRHLDNAVFSIVEDYILAHPMCNAIEVNRGTGVSIQDLLRFIDEGRLVIMDNKLYTTENK